MADPVKDQFEYIVKKFQDIVQRFDNFNDIILEEQKRISSQSFNMLLLSGKQNKFSEEFSKSIKLCEDNLKISHSRHENTNTAILNLALNNEKHKKDLEECKASILSAHEFIKNVFKELKLYAKNENLIQVNESLEEAKKEIDKSFYALEVRHNDLKIKYNDLKQHADAQKSLNLGFVKSVSDLESKINSHADNHDDFKRNVEKKLSVKEQVIKKYVDNQIAGIPQPNIPSLDEAKQSMEQKLEPLSLDAKNAHLRSANNEKKIQILEKKVEQLQLLLNKLQLGN